MLLSSTALNAPHRIRPCVVTSRVAAIAHEPFEARAIPRLPDVHVGVGSRSRRVSERRLVGLTRQLRMIAILVDEQDAGPM